MRTMNVKGVRYQRTGAMHACELLRGCRVSISSLLQELLLLFSTEPPFQSLFDCFPDRVSLWFHYAAPAGLELAVWKWTRLALNSQRCVCPSLLSAKIADCCCHTQESFVK